MYKHLIKIIVSTFFYLSTTTFAGLIDFTGLNEGIADEFNFTTDGINLTVSAWTTNVNTKQEVISGWEKLSGSYGVYKGSSGLGVISSDADGSHLDGGQSGDLNDLDEGLLFVFSQRIDFWGFAADYLSGNDDLNLSYVNFTGINQIETTDVFIDEGARNNGYAGFPVAGVYGTAFMVWVDGDDDDVRIADTYVTSVPEPNTVLLLSLCILMMTYRQRVN